MTKSEYSPWFEYLKPGTIDEIAERLRYLLGDGLYTAVYCNEG